MAPLAFFTLFYTMVPIITGIFSVMAVRYLKLPSYRSIGALLRSLLEMWPLILFPLLYLAFEIITPTFAVSQANVYLDPYIFPKSDYSHSIIGGIQFLVNNSYGLLVDLIRPASRDIFPVRVTIIAALLFSILIIAVRLWRRRLDTKISFVLIFTAVTLVILMAGSLAGLTPYGMARQAYFLILPLSVIIGYGASLVLSAIWTRLEFLRRSKLVPVILALLIVVLGTTFNIRYWHTNTSITDQNWAALHAFQTAKVDLVLYSPIPMYPVTRAYPELIGNATNMGWGTSPQGRGKGDTVPDDIIEMLTGNVSTDRIGSLLVITANDYSLKLYYPSWYELIGREFRQTETFVAPSVWGGIYTRVPE
jgi:hypothetical protein